MCSLNLHLCLLYFNKHLSENQKTTVFFHLDQGRGIFLPRDLMEEVNGDIILLRFSEYVIDTKVTIIIITVSLRLAQ